MRKILVLMFISALMLAALCGCGTDTKEAAPAGEEETLSITGLDVGDITFTLSDIKALEPYEGRAEGADSEGDPVIYEIKGGYLADALEQNGYSQADLAGIRIIATDGYSIEVSQDILKQRDVILAYEMDGEPLDSKNAPLRVFIPGERAMYWVRMVAEINVIGTVQSETVTGVYFMETLYTSDDYEDYEFIGQIYQTVDTNTILSEYPGSKGDVVLMTAQDGLEKNETLENFYKGVINFTGENSPEFFSNTLPGGMFVSNMKLFKYGGNAFYFAAKEAAQGGFTLEDMLSASSMAQAETYTISFKDAAEQTIAADELSLWTVGIEEQSVFISDGDTKLMKPVYIN